MQLQESVEQIMMDVHRHRVAGRQALLRQSCSGGDAPSAVVDTPTAARSQGSAIRAVWRRHPWWAVTPPVVCLALLHGHSIAFGWAHLHSICQRAAL